MARKSTTFAFIDSQNLNLGVRSLGWRLDYRKFRRYLTTKYGVTKAFLFIGLVPANRSLYVSLQKMGYILIFKPTMPQPDGSYKGNVDAELVLNAVDTQSNYSSAIIVSGDGDFYCLHEYLENKSKLLRIMVPNKHFSGLLRKFNHRIVRIDMLKQSLEIKKTRISGRSKP